MLSSQFFPDWENKTVVVIAAGSSAADVIDDIRHLPCIVVNRSFELKPDADILYAADSGFWTVYKHARTFKGLKVCPMPQAKQIVPDILTVEIKRAKDGQSVHEMQKGPFGTIGHGGNSGFQAVNLAVQCGVSRILLAGFDYCGGHWHEDHSIRLRNPTENNLKLWAQRLDSQSEILKQRFNVDVVNLSERTALKNYRYEKSITFNQETSTLST